MKIIQYENIQKKIIRELSSKTFDGIYISRVMELEDGRILKVFDLKFIEICKKINCNIENKIKLSEKMTFTEEIILPDIIVYKNGLFFGYTTPRAKGINFVKHGDNMTISERSDLKLYAKEQQKIENILKNNKNVVFSDICTCDNIFVDENSNFSLIDFDGMQIGREGTTEASTALGDISNKKYRINENLFNKNLDKRSSIILYFLSAFNLDLTKVGLINPLNGKKMTIFDYFELLHLDDAQMYDAVSRVFSDYSEDFLDDLPFIIAEKYNMKLIQTGHEKKYLKVLEKKGRPLYF